MTTFGERVRIAREHAGLTQPELATRVGIGQGQISKLETGVRRSSTKTLEIAEAAGVNPHWLSTGRGPMVISSDPQEQPGSVLTWQNPEDLPADDARLWIDRFDYAFSAGRGRGDIQWEVRERAKLPFSLAFFEEKRANPVHCKLVLIRGDSMEPWAEDHSLAMVNEADKGLRDGERYALYYDDEPYIKQVFKQPGGGLVLHSYNPAYPDIKIDASMMEYVRIVGRVIYRSG